MENLFEKEVNEIINSENFKIEGKAIMLVPFTNKHLHDSKYIKWLRDYEVMRLVGRQEYLEKPIPFSEIEKYVQNLYKSKNDYFFAIETKENSEFIGTLKLAQIDWHRKVLNLGILIGEKNYWRKGLAKDSFSTIIDFCFNKLTFIFSIIE